MGYLRAQSDGFLWVQPLGVPLATVCTRAPVRESYTQLEQATRIGGPIRSHDLCVHGCDVVIIG